MWCQPWGGSGTGTAFASGCADATATSAGVQSTAPHATGSCAASGSSSVCPGGSPCCVAFLPPFLLHGAAGARAGARCGALAVLVVRATATQHCPTTGSSSGVAVRGACSLCAPRWSSTSSRPWCGSPPSFFLRTLGVFAEALGLSRTVARCVCCVPGAVSALFEFVGVAL